MSSKAAIHRAGKPAIDLLEEAVRLLRRAPVATLLCYFIGSVPCMIAALFFLSDMSHGAFGAERLLPASLTLTALYFWMKCWQAVFAARLRSILLLAEPPRWTAARIARLASTQLAVHSAGLLLCPSAFVPIAPFTWISDFLLNITVLGDGADGGKQRELWARAWSQGRRWTVQGHVIAVLIKVFAIFVWLNVLAAMLLVPVLLKMFLGIETVFSRHIDGLLFNPIFYAATFAALYLCIDPLRKAVAVLRCFYGNSLRSGEDLEVQLRTVRAPLQRAATLAAVLCIFLGGNAMPARAAVAPPAAQVDAQELNRSIDDVLSRREYAWRAPREVKELPKSQSWFGQWRSEFDDWIKQVGNQFGGMVRKVFRKIGEWFSGKDSGSSSSWDFLSWLGSVRFVFYALLAVAVVLLVVLLARGIRRRRAAIVTAEAIAPQPDLTREDVTADQLPEDGWMQMARELMDRGELRLALRAAYLAGLAHLGQRELIRLARHKSNRDYDHELRRRARGNDPLLSAFDDNLNAFERSWYGEHAVTRESLGSFTENLERIRAC